MNFVFVTLYRALDEQAMSVGKEVKGRNHLYYQVLIDARDCPHIVSDVTDGGKCVHLQFV